MPREMSRDRSIVSILRGFQACGVPRAKAAKLAIAIVDDLTDHAIASCQDLRGAEETLRPKGLVSARRPRSERKKQVG